MLSSIPVFAQRSNRPDKPKKCKSVNCLTPGHTQFKRFLFFKYQHRPYYTTNHRHRWQGACPPIKRIKHRLLSDQRCSPARHQRHRNLSAENCGSGKRVKHAGYEHVCMQRRTIKHRDPVEGCIARYIVTHRSHECACLPSKTIKHKSFECYPCGGFTVCHRPLDQWRVACDPNGAIPKTSRERLRDDIMYFFRNKNKFCKLNSVWAGVSAGHVVSIRGYKWAKGDSVAVVTDYKIRNFKRVYERYKKEDSTRVYRVKKKIKSIKYITVEFGKRTKKGKLKIYRRRMNFRETKEAMLQALILRNKLLDLVRMYPEEKHNLPLLRKKYGYQKAKFKTLSNVPPDLLNYP